MHRLCRGRYVGDGGEGSGDIHSSFCLSRANKMDSMVNIGLGKLERMTSRESGEVRAMCRVKPRDGTNADTSRRVYLAYRIASINEGKDVVALIRISAFHESLEKK